MDSNDLELVTVDTDELVSMDAVKDILSDVLTWRFTSFRIASLLTCFESKLVRYDMVDEADFPNGSVNTESNCILEMAIEF